MMGPQSQEMAADLRYASPELAGKPVYQELEEPRPGPFQPKIEYELEAPGSRVG